MPIRLIAIDLDGTLLSSQGAISPENRNAIHAASNQGAQVVIITGRRYYSALACIGDLPRETIVISSNGARIASVSGEVYHRNFLPRAAARQMIEAAPAFRGYAVVTFDLPGEGQMIMQEGAPLDGPAGWYMRNSSHCLSLAPDLPAAILEDPIQVMFGGPPEKIEPVETVLRASPAAGLCHLTWTKYLRRNLSLLDVLNAGCCKGTALAHWTQRRGIRPEEVLAIGDNLNDFEMLHFAGQPVLMANHNYDHAPDGWPVTLSNDEDGVAEAIERYVLTPARI